MSIEYYDDVMGGSSARNDWGSSNNVSGDKIDDQMQLSCTAAKNSGITVFTIAFEAPSHAAGELLACATSASHSYDAKGTNITSVFSSIATTIQKLKLTM